MSALWILPAPDANTVDLVKWLADMAIGASEILQEATRDPSLRIVSAWLVMDLAALSEAASRYVSGDPIELTEEPNSPDRIEAMERLLEVAQPDGSPERAFAMAGIHWRARGTQ